MRPATLARRLSPSECNLPSDRVILNGMQFYGFHGVNAEEKALGQTYLVDLAVELDLTKPGQSDQLRDTVSYTHLYQAVKAVIEGEPKNLLESIADAIAARILDQHPVTSVQVTVKKPRPPLKGSVVDYAAVEIYRPRD
ncbi:MAG: dihydroneopterin aldolase [Chloroflexi bacterium]|nr:dihydroneopterin aldolase [Chloroflexota bacterium]